MKIIHSANVYWDYIHHHKIYYNWYKNELVCGHDTNDYDELFLWHNDLFVCRQCHFRIYNSGLGLTPKERTKIVDHIKFNHFVLIKIVNPSQNENELKNISITKKEDVKPAPRIKKQRHRHPLKPWKDPESLFCDTEFLENFIGKEPTKGKECK